jgi:F-type H+-transporting ATPase subunit a
MQLSPDENILFTVGNIAINATIVYTWIVMVILVVGSWLVTRDLTSDERPSRWQSILEAVVSFVQDETRAITEQDPKPYLPFVGTLFLFIATANLISIVPGLESPAGSLSLTTALALCVFIAVPYYGIRKRGLLGYLKNYIEPNPIMLPFNLISEFSRTLSLAVRLFGNIMSGRILVAIMLSLIPLFVPVALEMLGLVIGFIQAYIFAVLALVYIAGATSES